MSYILDALRRADTERTSGGVPSIHSRPTALSANEMAQPQSQGSPLLWLIVGLVIGLMAWVGLRLLSGDNTLPPPGAAPAIVQAPPSLPPPAVAQAPAITETAPATPPAADDAPVDVTPAIGAPAPQRPAPANAGNATANAPTPAPAARKPADRAPATDGSANAENTGEGRIYTPTELPEAIRRELPPLTVGGAMYSQTPANRMLIINGQLFHEGDKPAPGLVLEQIRLKGAVLKFKGYRYAIGF